MLPAGHPLSKEDVSTTSFANLKLSQYFVQPTVVFANLTLFSSLHKQDAQV